MGYFDSSGILSLCTRTICVLLRDGVTKMSHLFQVPTSESLTEIIITGMDVYANHRRTLLCLSMVFFACLFYRSSRLACRGINLHMDAKDFFEDGEYERALETWKEATEVLDMPLLLFAPYYKVMTFTGMGGVYIKLGDHTQAIDCYEKVVTIVEKLWLKPRAITRAVLYLTLGTMLYERYDYEQSKEILQTATKLFDQTDYDHERIRLFSPAACFFLGSVHEKFGNLTEARACLKKSLEFFQVAKPGSLGMGKAYFSMATVLEHYPSCVEEQRECYQKCISVLEPFVAKKLKLDPPNLARVYHSLGVAYGKLGKLTEAHIYMNKSIQLFDESETESPHLWQSHHAMAQIKLRRDDFDQALLHFHKARELAKSPLDLAATHHELGVAYLSQFNYGEAIANVKRAIDIRVGCQDFLRLAQSYKLLAFLYSVHGENYQALLFYQKAVNESERAGYLDLDACRNLGVTAAMLMTTMR